MFGDINREDLASIGNALLLGFRQNACGNKSATPNSHPEVSASQLSTLCRNLEVALSLSDTLDPELARVLDVSKDEWEASRQKILQRLDNLRAHKPPYAALTLNDMKFVDVFLDVFEFPERIRDLPERELCTPVSEMAPTRLLGSIARLIIQKATLKAGASMGMSPAEIQMIGLDGLRNRKDATRVPTWHIWNSANERRAREEENWVDKQRIKAQLHFRKVVEAHLHNTGSEDRASEDLIAFAEDYVSKKSEGEFVASGLSALGFRIIDLSHERLQTKIYTLFPSYGALSTYKDYRVDADPETLLIFFASQLGWRAVSEGWALALFQDRFVDQTYTHVHHAEFPILSRDGALLLPKETGSEDVYDLDRRAVELMGDCALAFVLLSDLRRFSGLDFEQPARTKPRANSYNEGFTQTDAKFVAEGVEWCRNKEAKSATEAAKRLVKKYGHVIGDPGGSGKIPTNSPDNTVPRLARKIRAALKKNEN